MDWNDLEKTEFKEYPYSKLERDIDINIDFSKKQKRVYISRKSISGTSYKCETLEDFKIAIDDYIDNHLQLENDIFKIINDGFKEFQKQDMKERIKIGKEFKKRQQNEMER